MIQFTKMFILPKFNRHFKKITYYLFFLAYGFFVLLTQTILVRELMIAFWGNELFTGIFLGIWFLGTGLGNFTNINILKNIKFRNLLYLFVALIILFPFQLLFIRFSTGKLYPTGTNPSPLIALTISFFTIFPFCFILGSLFKLSCNYFIKKASKQSLDIAITKAYLLETVGLILAGIIFNFFLINTSFPFSKNLNLKTYKLRFPNLNEVQNSKYGQIAITKSGSQINFYQNGKFLFSNQEQEQNEYLIHFIMSHLKNPQNILFIGNGLSGVFNEILKYAKVEEIDYLQLDSSIIQLAKNYLSSELDKAFSNQKINIIYKDPRLFLSQTHRNYNLIISNLPNPTTALFNRFYTQEYYLRINSLLKTNGIFATTLSLPTDYLSLEARNLFSQTYNTINSVFSNIKVYPEGNSILFISSQKPIINNFQELKAQFEKNNIKTAYFSSSYMEDRLSSLKITQFEEIIKNSSLNKINTDFYPNTYFLQTSFWQTMYSFKSAKLLNLLNKLDVKLLIFGLLILLFYVLVKLKKTSHGQYILVLTTGFILLTMEIILLFLYQSIIGLVFSKIALLFAVALSGVALGNISSLFIFLKYKLKYIRILEKILLIFQLLYLLIFSFYINKFINEYIFFLFLFLIGFIAGQIFPLANKIVLSKVSKKTVNLGYLYSADIFGALTGSIITSIFVLPILGIIKTVYLLIFINIFSLILLQKKLEQ